MPNVPLMKVADCWVFRVFASIWTTSMVMDVRESLNHLRQDDLVDLTTERDQFPKYILHSRGEFGIHVLP